MHSHKLLMTGYQLACPEFAGEIHAVPYNADNLGYIIVDRQSKKAALVDVVVPKVFSSYLKSIECESVMILTTHYHSDHQGGNKECLTVFPNVPIYKSAYETTDGTHDIRDGDTLCLGNLSIKAIHTPTHTSGHISYFISSGSSRPAAVLTGDFLFTGGCGRFFEGDAHSMTLSIKKIYDQCGEDTYMLPGHDYGISNLKFAVTVEPSNKLVQDRLVELQSHKQFVPAKLADELHYNPFIRCAMRFSDFQYAGPMTSNSEALLQELRTKKDKF
eukprot:Gregarina_sp_Poly_1__7781@NODE_43_length_18077_cov_117_559078_g37_i0_p10_GENE_NODE_43_length_18077_cov_117_559078_g37_i0NODE_43_length_18077_cov_117_559078_g37_i0_p10_ORF_typecomplete_len273_score27_83Lactamase_B/PF00753_27/7e19HAGH_C/PF16123_5/3_7e13Lactamase_B_2/PF12706_7/0_00045Lactamase_B_3/PF13483_6/0_011Lactamase_B_5/PF14597_6/0_017_NODE_43_length_18077_cov_117_559078_g37_i01675217570